MPAKIDLELLLNLKNNNKTEFFNMKRYLVIAQQRFWTPSRAKFASIFLILTSLMLFVVVIKNIIAPIVFPSWNEGNYLDWQSFDNLQLSESYILKDKYILNVDIFGDEDEGVAIFPYSLNVLVTSIRLPETMITQGKYQTCLSSIRLGKQSDINEESYFQNICSPWEGREELDTTNHYTAGLASGYPLVDVGVTPVTSRFYYPFDKYRIIIPFSVYYTEDRPDDRYGVSTAPEVILSGGVWGWVQSVTFWEQNTQQKSSIIQIDFWRPYRYKIMPVTLFGIIFVVIFLIIFIEESGGVLEVVVGVLFSLWGVRPILVPGEIKGFIFIDALIFSAYVLLAFMLFIRFIIRPVLISLIRQITIEEKFTSSNPRSEVPVNKISNKKKTRITDRTSISQNEPLLKSIKETSAKKRKKLKPTSI